MISDTEITFHFSIKGTYAHIDFLVLAQKKVKFWSSNLLDFSQKGSKFEGAMCLESSDSLQIILHF